jgi:hypothetical protein
MRGRPWKKRDLAAVLRLYPDMDTRALAAKMNRSVIAVYQRAQIHGIKKSAAYDARKKALERARLTKSGVPHRFGKGHVPANAGLRRPGYAPGRRNYKPIGALRVSRDGLLERKVSDDPNIFPARRWVGVHRLVWSAVNGPILAGHAVVFRPDRATTELAKITLDALELVTRAELMRRNSFRTNYPKDIQQVIQLRGALQRQINRRGKNAKQD